MRRVLLLAVLTATLWLAWIHETRFPLRGLDDPALTLVVPTGASAESIGKQLQTLGLVRHPLVFRVHVYLRGDGARLRAGEYSLEGPASLDDVAETLVRGEVVRHDVTFPEGKNLDDMAAIAADHGLDATAFLAAARDPKAIHDVDPAATDLEGYLFPDTYDVPKSGDPAGESRRLVGRMIERFRAMAVPEMKHFAAGNLTLREAVTLASIVELETAQADERPRIAAVFLNRLKLGMPLQTDPTVIYALRKTGTYDGNIRKKDLGVDSPYNTYKRSGLPPGPIASPGREALRAVAEPAEVKDLYFVSRNDGTHEFNETLALHERAVDRYQRHRATARPGEKS